MELVINTTSLLNEQAQILKGKLLALSYRTSFVKNNLTFIRQENVFESEKEENMQYKNIKIKKRNDNRWQARFLQNGKYKYVYGKTQLDCLAALKIAYKNKIAAGGTNLADSITLNEWTKQWLQIFKKDKVKESTFVQIDWVMKKYVLPKLGKVALKSIKSIDIEILLNEIVATRQREKTYVMFKDAMTKAFKSRLVKENVFDMIDKPKHTKQNGKAFSKKEQKAFLAATTGNKYGNLYKLLLAEGLRIGEALALTKDDIDFEKGKISITKTLNELGKITSPKTNESVREVPIFKPALPLLQQIVKYKGKFLFDFTYNAVYLDFVKVMQSIGLSGFSLHSTRHTFVTRCAENGISSKVVQKWVGHSTNKMTEEVYTHINSDFEQKQKVKFDTLFDTDF